MCLQGARHDLYTGVSKVVNTQLSEPLERMSALVGECRQPAGIRAWRPTGWPDEDMAAHDVKVRYRPPDQLLTGIE